MKHLLGKKNPRHDQRTLRLARYLTADLGAPPAAADFSLGVPAWPMMLNDQIGDCTCAAAGHLIQLWTAANKAPVVPPDADVLAAYEAVSGYNPVTRQNDYGANELDVLNYWRQNGIAGRKITAFAALNATDFNEIRLAVQLFGGAYVGIQLPLGVMGAKAWELPADAGWGATLAWTPGSWGGHAVPIVGYDADGVTVITWGMRLRATWAFLQAYMDEAYAVLSPDWDPAGGSAPNGLDLAALTSDLAKITGGTP